MKVVYVEWLDAKGINGRLSRKAANLEGLQFMYSSGIWVGEDDAVVRIAQDHWVNENDDGTTTETFRDVGVIPKSGVQRRVEWEIGNDDAA